MIKFYTAPRASCAKISDSVPAPGKWTFVRLGAAGSAVPAPGPDLDAVGGAVSGSPVRRYTKSSPPPPPGEARRERFALLGTARVLLSQAGRDAGYEYGHDLHRTAKCSFVMVSTTVAVHHASAYGKGFFSGLAACGSVWSCPICTAKIQERRREEIKRAFDWAYDKKGLQVIMVTLTFPHRSWHSLSDLLSQQADALCRLRRGSPWSRLKESIGYAGLIRSLELTHGVNGWHPHTHEAWITRKDLDGEALRARVLERWAAACAAAGLLDLDDADQCAHFARHAVHIKTECHTSDYLSKQDASQNWGVDRELAKSSSKHGKAKGLHPFGLLAKAREGCKKSGALFVDYSLAMLGKRQIFWSRGLKNEVGIEDIEDAELAVEQREESDLLGEIERQDWTLVRNAEARGEVLDAAEKDGWLGVQALLVKLREAAYRSTVSDATLQAVMNAAARRVLARDEVPLYLSARDRGFVPSG